jgi:putative selenium metabolism protein SsnA
MILIKNATVAHFDPVSVESDWDIIIDGSHIVKAGREAGSDSPGITETLDLSGKLVTPGIVCSHNHYYSALARGIIARIGPTPDFVSVLKNLWWRLDRALDEEGVYFSALAGALDAVKCGTTAVIDHHASPSSIPGSLSMMKEAFEMVGLRGILAYEVTDRNGREGMISGVKENIEFAKSVGSGSGRLIEAAIGAHAPFTLGEESLEMVGNAVKETGKGIHIHIGEDTYDSSNSHHLYSEDICQRLDRFSLIDDKSLFAHGLHLTKGDREIINGADSFLLHNPRSNMNNSVGYNRALSDFKNVALGTDGIGSDMFEETKFAFFKHMDTGGTLQPPDFLRFLNNGNRILERYFGSRFGRIEPGCAADLTIYDYDPPTPVNGNNLPGHLVFGLSSRDVETVIVGGRIVYRDRTFPYDVKELYAKMRSAASKLWKRMDDID